MHATIDLFPKGGHLRCSKTHWRTAFSKETKSTSQWPTPWPNYTWKIMQHNNPVSTILGARESVSQQTFKPKSATSIAAIQYVIFDVPHKTKLIAFLASTTVSFERKREIKFVCMPTLNQSQFWCQTQTQSQFRFTTWNLVHFDHQTLTLSQGHVQHQGSVVFSLRDTTKSNSIHPIKPIYISFKPKDNVKLDPPNENYIYFEPHDKTKSFATTQTKTTSNC